MNPLRRIGRSIRHAANLTRLAMATDQRAISPAGWAHIASEGRWVCAPHLDLLNQKLVNLARGRAQGRGGRLIVTIPPRHGKSEMISKYFPGWWLGMFPDDRVILTSYEAEFAATWGKKAQETFRDYAPGTFGLNVDPNTSAASRWNVQGRNGGMDTAGVGGPLTGKGAHCFPAGTMVETDQGSVDIRTLCRLKYKPRVRAFNHASGRLEWRRIEACAARMSDDLYEVRTVGGRVVRCTGNHPFYVPGRGYVPASLLAPGTPLRSLEDLRPMREGEGTTSPGRVVSGLLPRRPSGDGVAAQLRPLRDRVLQGSMRGREATPTESRRGILLRPGMRQAASLDIPGPKMPPVQSADARGSHPEILLRRLQVVRAMGGERAQGDGLPGVQGDIPAQVQTHSVLRPDLRRFGPRPTDGRTREFAFQGRHELREVVRSDEAADHRTRPDHARSPVQLLLGLLQTRSVPEADFQGQGRLAVEPGDPPYRRASSEQSPGESRDALPEVSRDPSQIGHDSVARVRRLCGPGVEVYDIQVEGCHNFFANHLLVHNCLIIDDPVKNAEEAASELRRNNAWEWFQSTAYTRIEPGGACVILMTRWHEDDLAGRVIAHAQEFGEPWEVIRIPALSETHQVFAEITRYGRAS